MESGWCFFWLCLSLWLIQDSNWKGELFGDYLEVSQQFFKTGFHVMNKKWEGPTSLDVKRAFIYSWFSLKKSATVNLNTAFLYGKGGRRMWRGHLPEGSVIVDGCFCFGNILKIYAFSPNFPLVALWLGDFIGYFFGIGCVQFYGWWFFQWKINR